MSKEFCLKGYFSDESDCAMELFIAVQRPSSVGAIACFLTAWVRDQDIAQEHGHKSVRKHLPGSYVADYLPAKLLML